MKEIILKYLYDFIESDDPVERAKLRSMLIELIHLAELNLDDDKGTHTKKLIIATIKSYDASDAVRKAALQEHYSTLEQLLRQ